MRRLSRSAAHPAPPLAPSPPMASRLSLACLYPFYRSSCTRLLARLPRPVPTRPALLAAPRPPIVLPSSRPVLPAAPCRGLSCPFPARPGPAPIPSCPSVRHLFLDLLWYLLWYLVCYFLWCWCLLRYLLCYCPLPLCIASGSYKKSYWSCNTETHV